MKREIVIAVSLFLLFNWTESGFSLTREPERTPRAWELGTEISHISYKEPGVMNEKGVMYGLAGSYTYRDTLVYIADARFAYGQVDYDGSGTINDIEDFIFETRGVVGRDLSLSDTAAITPYIGLGYRYLSDDSYKKVSSSGANGYLRESNYIYSPLGLEARTDLNKVWSLGAVAEYDIFWWGKQYSADFSNEQDEGYGTRGSIKLQRKGEQFDLIIEPFVRYWRIKDSKHNSHGYEPKNHSTEIGCRISLGF